MENAALYAKYLDGRHWERHPTVYAERFAAFLSAQNFQGILVDVGCGIGRDVAVFTELGFDALGLDASSQEIETAKRQHPKCRFLLADVESLPFGDSTIDAYFMINVIHYVNPRKAIGEMRRTLARKGLLFIHFNMQIVDATGKVDYCQNEDVVMLSIDGWRVVERGVFQRIDEQPLQHTHTILELILQKAT